MQLFESHRANCTVSPAAKPLPLSVRMVPPGPYGGSALSFPSTEKLALSFALLVSPCATAEYCPDGIPVGTVLATLNQPPAIVWAEPSDASSLQVGHVRSVSVTVSSAANPRPHTARSVSGEPYAGPTLIEEPPPGVDG